MTNNHTGEHVLPYYVHPQAEVEEGALVGTGTRIWRQAHVRALSEIGEECNIGKGVYVESHVYIGSRVKIQNHVSLFKGVTIEDSVFIGPHVCFTNDMYPRAVTVEGLLKTDDDWVVTPTRVCYGASIGAGAIIICGVTIGAFALVAAGTVVTKSVPPHALVVGNPGSIRGYVCHCARPLVNRENAEGKCHGWCTVCQKWCIIEHEEKR